MDIIGISIFLLVVCLFVLVIVAAVVLIKKRKPTTTLGDYNAYLEYRTSLPPNVRIGEYRDPYPHSYDPTLIFIEERPPLVFVDVDSGIPSDVAVPDSTGYSGFDGGDSGGAGASSDWGSSDSGSCDSGSSDFSSCDAGGGS